MAGKSRTRGRATRLPHSCSCPYTASACWLDPRMSTRRRATSPMGGCSRTRRRATHTEEGLQQRHAICPHMRQREATMAGTSRTRGRATRVPNPHSRLYSCTAARRSSELARPARGVGQTTSDGKPWKAWLVGNADGCRYDTVVRP